MPAAVVSAGDVVLAWDLETNSAVAREVTATLPHTDWLLDAHFSDGSVLEVTEDHRFWSTTDTAWVELQDLDTTDVLFTPDGATVTVDFLDWDAGVTTDAYDLTVDGVHNFFVAADSTAQPVLVHNANILGFGCGDNISQDAFEAIRRLSDSDLLPQSVATDLLEISSKQTREGIAEAIAAAGDDLEAARRIAINAVIDNAPVDAVLALGPARAASVLSSPQFGAIATAARRDALQAILESVGRNDLDSGIDELLELVFNSDRGGAAADWLSTNPTRLDDFVNGGAKSNSSILPSTQETGAWYEATVRAPRAEGWAYSDRIADDVVWDPSGTIGQWRPRTRPTPQSVIDARTSLSDVGLPTSRPALSRTAVLTSVNPPRPTSFSALTNNQLGQGVEAARVAELRAGAPNEVVAQATVRVTLSSGESFMTIADALTDPVLVGSELRLLFREMKASTVRAPTASSLTNNQALTADGLLNNQQNIQSIEVISGDGLEELIEIANATSVTVDRFVLESFLY